ncbi:hypothetical protein E2562_009090 [Oryza meyeriana var. granulata]|uniref:Uncharacterized protein n=1 Tax=Oryza meyeriana var. granulata TaxID=110450 RepID=A0A6G1D2W4_9ORYZ|nr:hypothetical protein E2562_009090 [Oryza meyeriana var. granulata]
MRPTSGKRLSWVGIEVSLVPIREKKKRFVNNFSPTNGSRRGPRRDGLPRDDLRNGALGNPSIVMDGDKRSIFPIKALPSSRRGG